jgi:hypothetical protein
MSQQQRKAAKGVIQRIADAIKNRKDPVNMADGTGTHVPTIRLVHGNWKSHAEMAQEQGFELRSFARTPQDTFLGFESRRTDETIKKHGPEALRDSGILERPINKVGDKTPKTGRDNTPMRGFIWDKNGYAQQVPSTIQVPLYADKGVNLGNGGGAKPEKLGGKTKGKLFQQLIDKGRDYEPNARAKARGEYVTKPKPVEPKSFSEVGEKAVGDIAKIGLAGGTAAGVVGSGVSYWTKKKESDRGGQK